MKKQVKVEIIGYDYFGRGISKINQKIDFIPKARIGWKGECLLDLETSNYRVLTLKKEDQIKTECPYFYECGGCHIRQMNEKEQLEFKVEKVKELFFKNANIKLEKLSIEKTEKEQYRDKVTFHIQKGKIGFYQEKTHKILPISKCLLLSPKLNEVLEDLQIFAKNIEEEMTAMVRSFGKETVLVLTEKKTKNHCFSFPHVDTLYYQGKCFYGKKEQEVNLLGVSFLVSPDSFFQIHLKGTILLYQKIKTFLQEQKSEKVLDLYCGVGSISLVIAQEVKEVYGIEVIKSAIVNARENAKRNKIKNVTFTCGKVEDLIGTIPKGYDTVIIDPPRKGLDKQTINKLINEKIELKLTKVLGDD